MHGHDRASKAEVSDFIRKLGFEPIVLHDRPNKGRTLITKFREEAVGAGFAVVLMTPDDLGKAAAVIDLKPSARQNVVFELGFFIGKLGPERVAALVEGNVELNRLQNTLLICVTHSADLASRFSRKAELADGRLMEGS